MRKSIIAIVAVMVAGAVSADLAISWKSKAAAVQDDQGAFVEGGIIQLIWSSTGPILAAGAYATDLGAVRGQSDGIGGWVLNSNVTGGYALWGPFAEGAAVPYTSADVGGANINTGFFFTRIFENNAVGEQYFVDVNGNDFTNPTDPLDVRHGGIASEWTYAGTDPFSVYGEDSVQGAPGAIGALTNDNGTYVIPEPATFGLMGVAALGMFLARKKARS